MPLSPDWRDLALRLALTLVAGALIGLNRDEHGRPAGLRTTMLVCLAASVAMIQANLLLATAGKPGGSFVVMDLMRLPLGILSGMGFLGAGAIIKRPNLVLGVTTAATLWFVTVIGLCFGGGQIVLGVAATAICLFILYTLKTLERILPYDQRALLVLYTERNDEGIARHLRQAGFDIYGQSLTHFSNGTPVETRYDVRWRSRRDETGPPPIVDELARRPGVTGIQWTPEGIDRN
jgi:putative Mg2+ transporter-C (MgtC) family protein